jgi:hypothetical protein
MIAKSVNIQGLIPEMRPAAQILKDTFPWTPLIYADCNSRLQIRLTSTGYYAEVTRNKHNCTVKILFCHNEETPYFQETFIIDDEIEAIGVISLLTQWIIEYPDFNTKHFRLLHAPSYPKIGVEGKTVLATPDLSAFVQLWPIAPMPIAPIWPTMPKANPDSFVQTEWRIGTWQSTEGRSKEILPFPPFKELPCELSIADFLKWNLKTCK